MRIFNNNYKRIKQENIDESAKLKSENRRMIERMTGYLSTKKISLYELEVIKKDIIGMAVEAENEGVSLQEKIGVSEEEFADSISLETKGNSWIEHCMIIACYTLLIASFIYFFEFAMEGFPENYGITFENLFFIVAIIFYQEVIEKVFLKKFLYSKKRKQINAITTLLYMILFGLWIMMPTGELFVIKGSGLMIGIILLVLTIMMYVGNGIYWNKQSKKFGAI